MRPRTPEPLVDRHVPHRSIDIITPQQADDATPEPDAFGLASRTREHFGSFGELVLAPLRVLVSIQRRIRFLLCLSALSHGRP